MVDTALQAPSAVAARKRGSFHRMLQRRSTIAFLMTLPLILLILLLVLYPAGYSLHLATLNKSMERFVGFGNFTFLFKRETFWMVVQQSCIFAITAVIFKALIGFIVAHFVHNIPGKGQRKWRGMLLVPWVIPPAMSCLAWLWLFDPSYSAFNWLLALVGIVVVLVSVKAGQIGAMVKAGKAFVPPPEAVTSTQVAKSEWQPSRPAIASLVAVRGVTLGAELPGTVRRIGFESGATVKQGAVLVQLDTSAELAQLESARAEAALSKLNLDRQTELRKGGAGAHVAGACFGQPRQFQCQWRVALEGFV